MARIRLPSVFSNLDNTNFMRFVSAFLTGLLAEFNGRIDFVENIRASGPISVTFPNSSTVVSVSHALGIVPKGYLVINPNSAQTIYTPIGNQYTWTDTQIFLKASGALVASIYII